MFWLAPSRRLSFVVSAVTAMAGMDSMPTATSEVGYEYSEVVRLECTFRHVLAVLAETPVGQKVSSPTLHRVRGNDLSIAIAKKGNNDVGVSLVRAGDKESWMVQGSCSCTAMASFKEVAALTTHKISGDISFKSLAEEELRGLMSQDGSVTFRVALYILAGPYGTQGKRMVRNVTSTLAADLAGLLEGGVGADVTVQLMDGKIAVHKAVLIARSPVFRRMFATDMEERRTGNIDMVDVSTLVAGKFIKFLYTDQLTDETAGETQEVLSLLQVADKYQVEGLKEHCCSHLAETLNIDTAASVLQAAHKFNIPKLKHEALNFITSSGERLAAVQDAEGFDDLDRDLLRELLEMVVPGSRKRKSSGVHAREFADDSDWGTLTHLQLRRACRERELPSTGTKAVLQARLSSR